MTLYWSGNPLAGGVDSDFILAQSGDTLSGGDGSDLILGDIGYFAPSYGNSLASAYDLEGNVSAWTTDENPLFGDASIPHRTAYGAPLAGETLWYAVTVNAGETITVDIDRWGGLGDPIVDIVDGTSNTLIFNDDASTVLGGLGSSSNLDSYVTYVAPTTATYFIHVREFGSGDGNVFEGDEQFLINISVTGHATGSGGLPQGGDSINGDAGNDLLMGVYGDDTIYGDAGNDVLSGGSGNDQLFGGDNDDRLYGDTGDDYLVGGAGADAIDGGTGNDTVDYSASAAGVVLNLVGYNAVSHGGDAEGDRISSVETFLLTPFNDVVFGSSAAEEVFAGGGSDIFSLGLGNDTVHLDGGSGHFVMTDFGHDFIESLTGINTVLAGGGRDTIEAHGGGSFYGEGGNDVIRGAITTVELRDGGVGTDTLDITGTTLLFYYDMRDGANTYGSQIQFTNFENFIDSDMSDTVIGTGVANIMTMNGGDDLADGRSGADTIDGGAGNDTITGGTDNDSILGGTGNDSIDGGDQDDIIDGGTENDWLVGGSGNDSILGGDGDDSIDGGLDQDTLLGGIGNDSILGGDGNDSIDSNDGNDSIDGGAGSDTILGGAGADTIDGGAAADTIDGGSGYDSIHGGLGVDSIFGGLGADRLYGDDGMDTLDGGLGNDSLFGGEHADSLIGGDGDDQITGGAGRDLSIGGLGADTFVYNLGDFGTDLRSGADRIADFSQAEGDRIDVSAVDANVNLGGNQTFGFIGSQAFHGVVGELHYVQITTYTYIEGDTDGDGVADFAIRLEGTYNLLSTDFVL